MPRTYVLDMMTHGWRIRILRCAGELRRLTRAWRLVQGAGLLTAVVADHAAISRETMNCLDDGYVHVDLDMVLNVVVTPGIKVHRHGCRPLMNGYCRSCATTLPETLGKFSRGMRVAIVVRTASERRGVLRRLA